MMLRLLTIINGFGKEDYKIMNTYIETPKMCDILREEFMEPMKISSYRLAQEIHVPVSRIQDLLHESRNNN